MPKRKDILVPIVFPDYKITVPVPTISIDIIPDIDFDDIIIPARKEKVSDLGHAGILLINGQTGLTKYYEYGRYDRAGRGMVRKVLVPNAKVNKDGIDLGSLVPVLRQISKRAGQSTRIEGVLISVDNQFANVNQAAIAIASRNSDPKREPYDLLSYNCMHFVKRLVEVAGQNTPWLIDPRPNSYIGEFRDEYPDIDYSPHKGTLVIEDIGVLQ